MSSVRIESGRKRYIEKIPGSRKIDRVNGNCYIIARDTLAVIDAGIPRSNPKILTYNLGQLHREPVEITTIFLPHFHVDHIGEAASLKTSAHWAHIVVREAGAVYISGKKPEPWYRGITGVFIFWLTGLIIRPVPTGSPSQRRRPDRRPCSAFIPPVIHPEGSDYSNEDITVLFSGDTLSYDRKTIGHGPVAFTMTRSANGS